MIKINTGVGIYSRAYDFVVPRLHNPPLLQNKFGGPLDWRAARTPEKFPYLVETYERVNLDGPKGQRRFHITVFLNHKMRFNVFEYLDHEITQEDVTRIVYECVHQIRPVTFLEGDCAFAEYSNKKMFGEDYPNIHDVRSYDPDRATMDRLNMDNYWKTKESAVAKGHVDPGYIGLKQGNHTGDKNEKNGFS